MNSSKILLRSIKRKLENVYVHLYSVTHKIKKQVLFESFSGKQYSDNPRFISEKLHDMFPDYKIFWKLNSTEDIFGIIPDYVIPVPKENVSFFPFQYLKVLATSFCFVTNEALEPGMPKRKGQFFVCTWHGDRGFKKIAADLEGFSRNLAENELADICIAGSDYGEEQFRSAFQFSGEIVKVGTPRDDILTQNDLMMRDTIRSRLSLSKYEKYLLYAPTFQDHMNHEVQINEELSLTRTVAALSRKTGQVWKILSRAHSAAYGGIGFKQEDQNCVIDVSNYPDMSDILLVADALITDYSSSPGDAALRDIPIILFHSKPYTRPLYFKLEDSPFLVAHNQLELESIIDTLTDDLVADNCTKILQFYGTHEGGKASEAIARRINDEYSNYCN